MIPVGTWKDQNTWRFCVWAPLRGTVELELCSPRQNLLPMESQEFGYWTAEVADLAEGFSYRYRIDGERDRPDPASFDQSDGVHAPSKGFDHARYEWKDSAWENPALASYVMYELHTGTFTPEGTFRGVVDKLAYLKELGVTAVELMPVAQFPGERNWGYDGVYPFAVQDSYGGPDGLKALVDACHAHGLAVILDVVYNHLGPEGNYWMDFAPCFTGSYQTPWGAAINFDQPYSYGVREQFIQNALYWMEHFHVDALRLDAIHGMYDFSSKHFLAEMSQRRDELEQRTGRRYYLIAESSLNDIRTILPCSSQGWGMDAQWTDDYHHAFRVLLTGERGGYYMDYGELSQWVRALEAGFVFDGCYSDFRKRFFGSSSKGLPDRQFVTFTQNHDQIGNRMLGERLTELVSWEQLKLAAGAVTLSPYLPMLFMGEEFAEDHPFQYFIHHGDKDLVEAVRNGRKEEFAHFQWKGEPPDPQAEETFTRCKLDWRKPETGRNRVMLDFYKTLLGLRASRPSIAGLSEAARTVEFDEAAGIVTVIRTSTEEETVWVMNFSGEVRDVDLKKSEALTVLIDSSDSKWNGPGMPNSETEIRGRVCLNPHSFILLG